MLDVRGEFELVWYNKVMDKASAEGATNALSAVEEAKEGVVKAWIDGLQAGQVGSLEELINRQGSVAYRCYDDLLPEIQSGFTLVNARDIAAERLRIPVKPGSKRMGLSAEDIAIPGRRRIRRKRVR